MSAGGEEQRLVLIVEGVEDARRLRRLLPELGLNDLILGANGAAGVQSTCRTLSTGFNAPHLGVCDRDLMNNEEVDDLKRRTPGLFVWSSRCLENELLHPPLVARALDMAGYAASEADVRSTLREIADTQYDQVHATLVDRDLRRRFEVPRQREDGEPPIGLLRREYESRRDSALEQVMAVQEVSISVEASLRRRWNAQYLLLLNGKRALPQVAQRLAPGLKGGPGLETVVLRHALDYPPPGVAALRSEIARLVGGT